VILRSLSIITLVAFCGTIDFMVLVSSTGMKHV
jgi:hypothetical protein